MNLKLILGLLAFGLSAALAQQAAPDTSAATEEVKKNGLYYQDTLDKMKSEIPPNAYDLLLLHSEAEAQAAELISLEKNAPKRMKNTSTQAIIIAGNTKACSLYVEILRKQIETQKARERIAANWAKRLQTMDDIEATQELIGEARSGRVSNLAADLDAERLRLAQTSEDLKSTEQAAKDREAALQKALDEERKKAEARQQEARNRLNELQSRLIQVTQDARGIILSMSDILFDVNKATLKDDLKESLAKIAGILSVYQELNVSVEGHTDNTGTDAYNMKLSEQRAQNVKDYLVSQGIDASRLSSKGLGKTMPVATNDTKEGRQKNRRVDLVIQDKLLLEK
ncbi:MAG: OmpA family protein [Fibrobacter sp.]|jgi:outer membrane protein OmpA-like peptidoglycan-associated protein|nr:OmpA family protein [Fibrobacter sp.]